MVTRSRGRKGWRDVGQRIENFSIGEISLRYLLYIMTIVSNDILHS